MNAVQGITSETGIIIYPHLTRKSATVRSMHARNGDCTWSIAMSTCRTYTARLLQYSKVRLFMVIRRVDVRACFPESLEVTLLRSASTSGKSIGERMCLSAVHHVELAPAIYNVSSSYYLNINH